jgi:HD-like signal output (HDOD) protein
MLRILFVDDERILLDALKSRMRRQRTVWSMRFVESGQAALAALDQEEADVVVTDSRMPGMEGPELLQQLKERHPQALRILLSGAADERAVLDGLRVAHQYLVKPCPSEQLVAVVDHLSDLRKSFSNEAMQRVIHQVDRLPAATGVQAELAQLLADPDVDLKKVGAVAERDPALSVRLLRLANSAFHGGLQPVTQVASAVARLGTGLVHGIILGSQVLSAVESALGEHRAQVERAQERALKVAVAASRLLKGEGRSGAYLGGLLHDVGGLVLLSSLPEHRSVLFDGAPWAFQRAVREKQLLGFTHAEVGAYLLGTWGLPAALVETVARQHAPPVVGKGLLDAAGAVHLAQGFVMEAEAKQGGSSERAELNWEFVTLSGLNLKALAQEALF